MTGPPCPTGNQVQIKPQDVDMVSVQDNDQELIVEVIENIVTDVVSTEEAVDLEPVTQDLEAQNESSDNTDRLSVTDLINLDNISAHNLYLGSELRRLGSSAAVDSDAGSGFLATDDEYKEDTESSFISSAASSTVGGQVEIDYSALDRFGFIVLGEEDAVGRGGSSEEDKRIRKKQAKKNMREAHRATKWVDMLKILEESKKPVSAWPEVHKKFSYRLAKGIPDCLRSKVWGLFSTGAVSPTLNPSKESFRELYMRVSGFERQIDLDIERTLRDHVLFKIRFSSAQVSLFKILVAYSNLDPAVGYCQGMSTVAAFMLLYFEEEAAFNVFVQVMQRARMRHLYIIGFGLLFETFFIHEQLMQKFLPIIHAKLASFHITTSIYATKWYLTLFLGFSFQLATRIWDLFLYYGFDILIVASIALLKMHEDRILRLDYEHCMEFLSRLADSQIDENKLIDLTMRIWERLVPSLEVYWAEQEELTRCDLSEGQVPTMKPTKKSSVFFRLRKAYALMKEKDASTASGMISKKVISCSRDQGQPSTMAKIQVSSFDAFPHRTLTLAYCKPAHDLSLKKEHVLSQGLIAINASLIADPFIVLVAANKCVVNEANGSMKTKSLAAELLYTLSPSLHVTESLKTFGLSPGMGFVLFAAFDMELVDVDRRLDTMVTESELLELNSLPANSDMDRIVKTYKVVNPDDAINEISCLIAVKGI